MGLELGSGTIAAPIEDRGSDLYETPSEAIWALMKVECLPFVIWEPACGPGAIVRQIRATGRAVVATDLVDYGCEDSRSRIDFLMEQNAPIAVQAIVTNPPYSLAREFAEKGRDLVPEVHLLLRLAFLEGLRWEEGLADCLSDVRVFAPRCPMMHRAGWEGPKISGSAMPLAWFSWRWGWKKPPQVSWINYRKLLKE